MATSLERVLTRAVMDELQRNGALLESDSSEEERYDQYS